MKKTTVNILIGFGIITGILVPALSYADTTSFAHLGLGSRGANVTALQTLLATDQSIYPEGLVTGYYGSLTVKAIKRFQLKNGFTQTGAVGPLTLGKLNEMLAVTQYPSQLPTTPTPSAGGSTTPPVTTPTTTPVTTPVTTPTTTPAVATTTPAAPVSTDTTAPSISYITASNPSSQSSTVIIINWSTNEMATTKVYFTTATPLDIATASSTSVAGLSYQHSVTITGLQYNTGYNYVIESADAAGNVTRTQSQTFHTTD